MFQVTHVDPDQEKPPTDLLVDGVPNLVPIDASERRFPAQIDLFKDRYDLGFSKA